jgi:hypothetical protein
MVLFSQIYCLLFRYITIHSNKTLYRAFISIPGKVLAFSFQQSVAILFAFLLYQTFIKPEVNIKNPNASDPWFQDFKARLSLLEPLPTSPVDPDRFFIWVDLKSSGTRYFMAAVLTTFLVTETMSVTLVYWTLRSLKAEVSKISKQTFKMHKQLIYLLGIQVGLWGFGRCIMKN